MNWPHQDRAIDASRDCYKRGVRSWCIVAPCGAGKSRISESIAFPAASNGKKVSFNLHRRMLTRQFVENWQERNIQFGVNAADYPKMVDESANLQVNSTHTLVSRIRSKRAYLLPECDIRFWDEAHAQCTDGSKEIIEREAKAKQIWMTATPVGLGGFVDELVMGGNYSEMLECKAHLPLVAFGPECPDEKLFKKTAVGEFSENGVRKVMKVPTIAGNVFDWWQKLNPLQLPAVGFAPGVQESIWFVEYFARRGVQCAHIDSDTIILCEKKNGTLVTNSYGRTETALKELEEGSKSGKYKIVWNRFVLREAVNWPWLYHAIAATAFGGIATYLQSVGRVMRYWSEYDHVVFQDHGGNVERHGMPNEDRDWILGDTNQTVSARIRKKRQETKGEEAEPITCPKCSQMRLRGSECPSCGHKHSRSVRMVRQTDGALVKKIGRKTKYKRPKGPDDYLTSALYAAGFKGMSVGQAVGYAISNMSKDGITGTFSDRIRGVKLPSKGDPEWYESVRKIFNFVQRKK